MDRRKLGCGGRLQNTIIFSMVETKFGTFDKLLAITVPELRPIAVRLKETILDVDPDAGPRLALEGLGHLGGVAGEVAHVADRGFDHVVAAAKLNRRAG